MSHRKNLEMALAQYKSIAKNYEDRLLKIVKNLVNERDKLQQQLAEKDAEVLKLKKLVAEMANTNPEAWCMSLRVAEADSDDSDRDPVFKDMI